jgi:hypothetical protein
MTDSEIAREPWPPEIEIAVRHSQIFILRLGVDRERQIIRPIQNLQFARNDFYVAGGKIWILCARQPRGDATRNLNYVFTAQSVRFPGDFRIFLWSKDNLGQPLTVTQIDENHAAMIARDIYPAGKRDLPADVCLAK